MLAAASAEGRHDASRENHMDPNNPGQNPGGPPPPPSDPWGQPPAQQPPAQQPPFQQPAQQPPFQQPAQQPPAPGQPGYGAPPEWAGGQPGYGAPPEWAGGQPGYGAPPEWAGGQPGYGAPPSYGPPGTPYGAPPAWGAPPPQPSKSRVPKIIGAIVLAVIVLIAIGAVIAFISPNHAGQVLFTTDAPTSEGAKTCQVGHTVTSASVGDPIYAIYFFKNRLTNETVTLIVLKDGQQILSTPLSSDESNGIDCLEDYSNLGDILTTAGTYEFKLTTSSGETVSDGTLTIKQP
jgi:hypothetical protein